MIWIVIALVPYGLIIAESGMNVNWATLGIPVLVGPILIPLFLTITWAKATAKGVVSGKAIYLYMKEKLDAYTLNVRKLYPNPL